MHGLETVVAQSHILLCITKLQTIIKDYGPSTIIYYIYFKRFYGLKLVYVL